MSEEVVNNCDMRSLDPEVIIKLYEFKCDAIEAIVNFYSKIFDKIFSKSIDSLKPEEKQKFQNIKENHLKEYKSFIDKTLDSEMEEFFTDSQIFSKLFYLSNNSFCDHLIEVPKAVQPFKQLFMSQLKQLEQNVNNSYENKVQQNNELQNKSLNHFNIYDKCRKTLQKKVNTILNELESIDLEDLN